MKRNFGLGIALSVGIGTALGVALKNTAIGFAIGAGLLVVFIAAVNRKAKS